MMVSRAKVAIVGVLIGLAVLTATSGLIAAQESTPTADQSTMMPMATPAANEAEMAAKMDQMMDQCLAMMKMMSSMMGMMGGQDMQGMMGGGEMQGMMGTPAAATPGA